MRIVPKDKSDYEACKNLSLASNAEVKDRISELLEWCQDINWPVASRVIDRIKTLNGDLVNPVRKILKGNDAIWKYWIITNLLSQVESGFISELKEDLESLVSDPSKEDISEEVNLVAMELLESWRNH